MLSHGMAKISGWVSAHHIGAFCVQPRSDHDAVALQEAMKELAMERKALHNQVIDLRGAVRVIFRQRPQLSDEQARGYALATRCDESASTVDVLCGRCVLPPLP